MTHKPEPARVKSGYWRHRDGTKEYGIRIWCGQRHIFIGAADATAVADAIHDLTEELEGKQA